MTQNIRLQNLRDFTVQIRNANDEIVGTGIAVSTDGKIVTCAHVVRDAGVDPQNSNGNDVGIYFPQARGGDEKNRKAKVVAFFHEHDDDMVLLQLEGASPLAPEQIAVLGMADKSEGNLFRTYGYSPIGNYPAARGDGVILGSVEPPADRNLKVDPVQLKSRDISSGMSGAAVLDVTRNLVVGLVAERFYPEGAVQDDIGYGVDSKVLTFNPFEFVLREEFLELKPAPEFRLDKDLLEQAIEIGKYILTHRPQTEKFSWNNAPSVLTEWTGREHLLEQITSDWNEPTKHVTGLIGFGGEGKSSIARKWVETINLQPSNLPTGVFWWGFYENRSVDEFLEAALKYMSGGRIDPRQVQSSNLRAQIIGAMLGTGRYLFVLDGLEVMQHQEGDQYGLIQSNDLRDLLTFFARPDNQCFCLITSRAPLLDLMEYTTYTHRDVDRLSEADGRALLRRLAIKGNDNEINKVVSDWDGHALTLSILAAYLAERYEGAIKHLADIPIPTTEEPRYERVHRVLRRYDEHLKEQEREFLKLFSVFRVPVQESAFGKVFEPLLKLLSKDEMLKLVSRLVGYRLIRHDEYEKAYTTHPLIRNHYFALFTKGDPNQGKVAHSQIKDYYLSITGDTPEYPTLDDLKPLIEVVHHACQAGAYDEARDIFWQRIYQGEKRVIIHQLSAYEIELNLISEFFPSNDTSKEPGGSSQKFKRFLNGEIGLCLMNIGRLPEAVLSYERQVTSFMEVQDWRNVGIVYHNLAELYLSLGALDASAEAARQALGFNRRSEDKDNESHSLSYLGQALSHQGNLKEAEDSFEKAQILEREDDPSVQYLTRVAGVKYSKYLQKTGNIEYCRTITSVNLNYCERNHWFFIVSLCYNVLGDLDSDSGNSTSRMHYESALKIARSISMRFVLIEALLARGRFFAKHMKDANAAFNDLNESLGYCVESGYRIHEADVRVALGWAYLANSEKVKAKQSAERALQMSNEMGYHWGKVDAKEVLERIENSEQKADSRDSKSGKGKLTTKATKQTKKKSSRS